WSSREAGATIGCRGSCERTELQFAGSGWTPWASWLGRRNFTIRFSFLPDHIDQFADLTGHGDFGLALVNAAAVREAIVQSAEVLRAMFAVQHPAGGLDEGPPQRVVAGHGNVPP